LPNLCICTNLCLEDQTGGSDRIIGLAKNVAKQGFKVFLIDLSARKSFRSFLFDSDKYYIIQNGNLSEEYYPFLITFLFPGIIKFFQEIINRLVSVVSFSSFSAVGLSYLIDPYLIVKILYVCKKQRIDLLQNECTVTCPSAFVVKKMLNIPLVYDAHNIEVEMTKSLSNASRIYIAGLKLVEKSCFLLSDSVFVVSETDKAVALSWGIPEKKLAVIPNSIDMRIVSTNVTDIRKRLHVEDKIVLIFHGTLSYPPNQEAAIILAEEIMPKITEKEPTSILFLVGKDPPKIKNPNVIATGFVENLADYISAADIAVVPLLKGGGTRVKILEYMASGKAVVSTLKGAEGLNVKNGTDILMTKDVGSKFISFVLELIADTSLRNNISKNAKRNAESLYNWQKTAVKAVEIYKKLLSDSD
jgi:polysaccharide biosynthesis protein PslH